MHVCVASVLLMTVVLHCVDLREEVSQTKAMLQAKSRELQVLQHYKVRLSMQIMQQSCGFVLNFEGCMCLL